MHKDPFLMKRYGKLVAGLAISLLGLASILFLVRTHLITNALLENAQQSQLASPLGER